MKKVLFLLSILLAVLVSCSKDTLEDGIPLPWDGDEKLVLDVSEFPYGTLSEYRFFKGPMADQRPRSGLLPFEPISSLFTDYAKKKRFVWMPEGVMAQYQSDGQILDMPNGTVLIKNFYYDNVQPTNTRRIIETRIIFKRNGGWEFANYVWNNAQNEAVYDLTGSITPLTWIDEQSVMRSVNYRIPAEAECHTCHKENDQNVPIAIKPQSLNSTYPYADGDRNQLIEWVRYGYLASGYPKRIATTVKWNDPNQALEDRVRAYLDMNCAHCHKDDSHCDYRPVRFAYNETTVPANLGVCIPPDDPIAPGQTHIVARGNPARSMMFYRLSSTDEAVRMPLLGRTLVHDEGLALIQEWINSLSPPCN